MPIHTPTHTPRTDAHACCVERGDVLYAPVEYVPAAFVRGLERELAAWKECSKTLATELALTKAFIDGDEQPFGYGAMVDALRAFDELSKKEGTLSVKTQ